MIIYRRELDIGKRRLRML